MVSAKAEKGVGPTCKVETIPFYNCNVYKFKFDERLLIYSFVEVDHYSA